MNVMLLLAGFFINYSYFTVKLSSSDSQTILNAMGEMVQKPYLSQ